MRIVKVLEAIEIVSRATGKPQQRRGILQRDDGYFSFVEEYSYTSEWEGEIIAQGWAQLQTEGDTGQDREPIGLPCVCPDSFQTMSAHCPDRLSEQTRGEG
jgi:hypothetical protein